MQSPNRTFSAHATVSLSQFVGALRCGRHCKWLPPRGAAQWAHPSQLARQYACPGHKCGCCLTLRSRRGPTARHQAREAVGHIIGLAGLAPHRRSRLTSNVRRREDRLRTFLQLAPLMSQRFEQVCPKTAASLQWAVRPSAASGRARLLVAFARATRGAFTHRVGVQCRVGESAGLSGKQPRHGSACEPPRLPLPVSRSPTTKSRSCRPLHWLLSASLEHPSWAAAFALGYIAQRRLTLRSRRGPTAWHQAREAVGHIIGLAGLAPRRRSRLTSNVRRHESYPASPTCRTRVACAGRTWTRSTSTS